jgi:hypothetical protein
MRSGQCYYLYAFTGADCPPENLGPGVDPRFGVELVRHGALAAGASRVGLDQFDPARLQGKAADDVHWLSRVAVRHNEIICRLLRYGPVLPLRLGTFFRSQSSLLAMLARCEGDVTGFLHELGDRQEWAVKIYLSKTEAEEALGRPGDWQGHVGCRCDGKPLPHCPAEKGAGVQYLNAKRIQLQGQRRLNCRLERPIQQVEGALADRADRWCRVRLLPAALTGQPEKMIWNAAFLLPSSAKGPWLAAVEHLSTAVLPKGLRLEVTGPWPPYHFCPELST